MNIYRLHNGLRVVVEPIPTFRSVSFGIWVKTGSRNETPEDNGISHFIEHMLFKGTARYSAKQIADIFDGIGGNVNAFTAKEYTCYYCKVLDEHLPTAIDILADMFFGSELSAAEMDKEKKVILEEIAMYEDTPDDLVHDLASRAVYAGHPLGFTILGLQDRLEAMQPTDLRNYMQRRYRPDNTVVSIAGHVTDDVLALVERFFGGFAATSFSDETVVPEYHDGYIYHAKKTEQNHLCLTLPGYAIDHPNMHAMVLLNNLIGGGMSSHLFQEIREKRGLAYAVYSYHTAYTDSGTFTIYAGTAPEQTQQVLDVTTEVLASLRDNGVAEDELSRGKEQLKGNLILSLESTSSRMNRMGKNELLLSRHYTLDELIAQIDRITIADIRAASDLLFSRPFAVSMVGGSDKALATFRRDLLVASR